MRSPPRGCSLRKSKASRAARPTTSNLSWCYLMARQSSRQFFLSRCLRTTRRRCAASSILKAMARSTLTAATTPRRTRTSGPITSSPPLRTVTACLALRLPKASTSTRISTVRGTSPTTCPTQRTTLNRLETERKAIRTATFMTSTILTGRAGMPIRSTDRTGA